MSDSSVTQPPPLPQAPAAEPMVSTQSQIGLAVVAIFTVLSFIFHKDFSSIVPAITVLALSVYGAAIAIARALKHRTLAQATMVHNQQRLDAWTLTQTQVHTDRRLREIEARLPDKTTPRKTTARQR